MTRYRVVLDLTEAAERVAHFNRDGTSVTPWDVLGISTTSMAAEIAAAYTVLCDAEAPRCSSLSVHDRVEAEERIRDYTAAMMVIEAD